MQGVHGDGRRPDLGEKHMIQCTDDAIQNSAPETCRI